VAAVVAAPVVALGPLLAVAAVLAAVANKGRLTAMRR
jgi:hypothetical protein